MGDRKVSTGLFLAAAGAVLLILAMAWGALPWGVATMVTCAAFAGMELGMIGARWADEHDDH